MPTYAYYIAAGLAILLIVTVLIRRGGRTPSLAMFRAIEDGISRIQTAALRRVLPEQPEDGVKGFDREAMVEQTIRLQETIRFVYTVEQREDGFGHTVSSQLLKRKGRKYHLQCMLVVILILNRQLSNAGINQDDVAIGVDQSGLGTLYVHMSLSPEQHERFAGALSEAA